MNDHLFHGSRKSIRDSLKYCFADTSIDYMQFLEECRKSEEEGKAGQARSPVKVKVRAAAATLPPKEDGLSKQLKYQQHQIDAFVGQVKDLVAVVKATHTSPRVGKNGSSYNKGKSGKGNTSQNRGEYTQAGQRGKDMNKQYQCWQCGEVWHLRRECLSLKDKGAVSKGECRSSPQGLKRHSPNKQASIGVKSVTNEGVIGDDLVEQKGPAHMGVWEKLVGRANKKKLFYKWATSDCIVRHWEPGDTCQP